MKILKKQSRNRKAQFFVQLDIYSLIFFVVTLILLLIVVLLLNNNKKKKIDNILAGANAPHFFMNILDNEQVVFGNKSRGINHPGNICQYTQRIKEKMTRAEFESLRYYDFPRNLTLKEALLWLNYNIDKLPSSANNMKSDEIRNDQHNQCLMPFIKNLKEKFSYLQDNSEDIFGVNHVCFEITLSENPNYYLVGHSNVKDNTNTYSLIEDLIHSPNSCSIKNEANTKWFKFRLPTKSSRKDIKIIMYYLQV